MDKAKDHPQWMVLWLLEEDDDQITDQYRAPRDCSAHDSSLRKVDGCSGPDALALGVRTTQCLALALLDVVGLGTELKE